MRDPEFQDNLEMPLRIEGEGGKPRAGLWRRLSRVMEVIIYLLLLVAVVKLFGPEWDRQNELKSEKNRLVAIREGKNERVMRLRQEHRLLKTDKEYLETVARDRLDLQREGEYVIRIDRSGKKGE